MRRTVMKLSGKTVKPCKTGQKVVLVRSPPMEYTLHLIGNLKKVIFDLFNSVFKCYEILLDI